jgi:hypothetical protein
MGPPFSGTRAKLASRLFFHHIEHEVKDTGCPDFFFRELLLNHVFPKLAAQVAEDKQSAVDWDCGIFKEQRYLAY